MMSCMNFLMTQTIIEIFRRETDGSIEENSYDVLRFYLYGTINKYRMSMTKCMI